MREIFLRFALNDVCNIVRPFQFYRRIKKYMNSLKNDKGNRLNTLLMLASILSAMFLVSGCGLFMKAFSGPASSANSAEQQTNTTNSSPASPSFDSAKYSELLSKREELAKKSFPARLDQEVVIKGKVFVAASNLEKFSDTDKIEKQFADYRLAKSLDEVGTVVQINCSKGRYVTTYVGKNDESVKGFAVDCKVSLVDHTAGITVAQKNFSNSKPPEVIKSIEADAKGEYLMPRPLGDISKYLHSFLVDREMPSPNILSDKELLRLRVKPATGATATIKGKAMIAQRSEYGEINPVVSNTDYSGLGLSYGLTYDRLSSQPNEVKTIVKIICTKGNQIGKVGNTTQFSNRCVVSLIDRESLTLLAEKTIENRAVDQRARQEDFPMNWIVSVPKGEIEAYIRSLPVA